jgi:hypothetical protein
MLGQAGFIELYPPKDKVLTRDQVRCRETHIAFKRVPINTRCKMRWKGMLLVNMNKNELYKLAIILGYERMNPQGYIYIGGQRGLELSGKRG